MLAELCLVGLRVAADRLARADPRRSDRARSRDAAAVDRYERHLAALTDLAAASRAEAAAWRAGWRAERSRLDGDPDPAAWAETHDRWTAVARLRPAVLARIRHAEALLARPATRADAPDLLERAVKEAEAIGSRLLAALGRDVGRRAGVTVGTTEAAGSSRAPGDQGTRSASLTRREREVLDLLASGATNRQIATALYISAKTASVHVSRILAKLGVDDRAEAAALARRK
jgi:DNA-binding CsgD family transcriptional regulator